MPETILQETFASDDWELLAREENCREESLTPSLTYGQDVLRRLKQNVPALAGAAVILLLILTSIFGPLLSSHSYEEQELAFANVPPVLTLYRITEDHYVYLHRNMKLIETSAGGNC